MPSYKRYLVLSSLLLSLSGCSNELTNLDFTNKKEIKKDFRVVQTNSYQLENMYILFALEYESRNDFANARAIYEKLFDETNNYEYLLSYSFISYKIKDYKALVNKVKKADINNVKEEEAILRLYIHSLLKLKDLQSAVKVAKSLINKYNNSINIELLAYIYNQTKDYKNAQVQFEKAYKLQKLDSTLIALVNIQYYHNNQKQKARKLLEEFISKGIYNYTLCVQLLSFYEQEKRKDDVLKLLASMYESYKKTNSKYLIRTKALYLRYLTQKDINKAISFLEKENDKSRFLLSLYRSVNESKKAYELLEYLYNKTKKPDYLAQMAILQFELAQDKKTVLNEVIYKFKEALKTMDNHTYENYLAYILIDYDIDVKEGLKLVKKALKKKPNDLAYIDTLAWGQYKLKNCQDAKVQMKKVVDKLGLKDKEIKLHWEKIKECTK